MSTYRTGSDDGFPAIVRETTDHPRWAGTEPQEVEPDTELVAVVVNGDQALAERIAWLLTHACPTCMGPQRETVDMVCQACGTDYARRGDHVAGPTRWREREDAPSAQPVTPSAAEQGSGVGRDRTEAPGRSERATEDGPCIGLCAGCDPGCAFARDSCSCSLLPGGADPGCPVHGTVTQ